MTKQSYIGINVQYPISEEIIRGRKSIETRTYPIPKGYAGQTLLLVETPGKLGKFQSRIVAKIKFSACFKYRSKKEFYLDKKKHLVTPDSPWAWTDKPKWGWVIEEIKPLKTPVAVSGLGIRFTKNLTI